MNDEHPEDVVDFVVSDLIQKIRQSGINITHFNEEIDSEVDAEADESTMSIGFSRSSDFNKFMWICFMRLDVAEANQFRVYTPFCDVTYDEIVEMQDAADTLNNDPFSYLEHQINVTFPISLRPKIESAFTHYLQQMVEEQASQLQSVYDEVTSRAQLARYFIELIQFYFSDPFDKFNAQNLEYVVALLQNISWYPDIELHASLVEPQKLVAIIPNFYDKLREFQQEKLLFDEGWKATEIARGSRTEHALMLFGRRERQQQLEPQEEGLRKKIRSRSPSPRSGTE